MDSLLDQVTVFVGELLFTLLGIPFLGVINTVDSLFRALAGIGSNYSVDGYTPVKNFADGGIVYDLLQADIIKKLIMSIMLLAAFLLIIFTVMAFLKNVYAQKQKTTKEIISNSIKGVLYFVFVPVCTLLGVYLGNIVLKAVDGATSLSGSNNMAAKLFLACSYDANEWRGSGKEVTETDINALQGFAKFHHYESKNITNMKVGISSEEFADCVDEAFANVSSTWGYNVVNVAQFYRLWDINYLLLIVGGCFMLYVLCSLAFAMARRIFIMLIWFVISPACCAMFPLDEGKMVGKYKDEMTKQVLSAYGAIAGVNLFLSIMPLIERINLGDYGNRGFIDLFILICGLLCVKELVSSLSSLVGGEDALAKGSSLMKSSTGALKKYAGGVTKKVSGAVGAFRADTKGKSGTAWWGAAAKSIGKHQGLGLLNMATGIDVKGAQKSFKEGFKAEKAENRESAIGKSKKQFLKGITKRNYTGEELVKLIDEDAADAQVSAEDVFEATSGRDFETEKKQRGLYREAKSADSKRSEARATNGAAVEKAKSDADSAHQQAESTGKAEESAKTTLDEKTEETKDAATTASDEGEKAKTNADTSEGDKTRLEKATIIIKNAYQEIENGNFEAAAAMLGTIDTAAFDSEGSSEFKASLAGLVTHVNQAIAAQEALTAATKAHEAAVSAETAAVDNMKNVATSVADALGDKLGKSVREAAEELKGVDGVKKLYEATKEAMGIKKGTE